MALAFVCAVAAVTFASEVVANGGASLVKGEAPTCGEAGYLDAWYREEDNTYFEDEACTLKIDNYGAWIDKYGGGYLPPTNKHIWGPFRVNYLPYTEWHIRLCTECRAIDFDNLHHAVNEDWSVYYSKRDNQYYHNRTCSVCGLVRRDHVNNHAAKEYINPLDGKAATSSEAGYKEAYLCTECNLYYEDAEGTIMIGDKDAYEEWKKGAGYLAPTGNQKSDKGVPTGDNENIALWMMLAIAAVVAAGYAASGKEN